ncbi:MAG TPA: efflux transporter outer membrane subunit [Burkholderiales bacterium]|jgi:NodT family efflux transporter outer membrane factor (OMF) lipoprotein|nr:efflux transporter outer membrane subunit [Burkholderiales bacterium]
MKHDYPKRAVTFCMLALLAGCAVGPNYVRPGVTLPAAYKENGNWKPARPQDLISRGNWWQIFGDPKLNTLEQQIDISNQNVRLAEAQFREARALVQAARAGYFPTVSGTVSTSRSGSSSGSGNRIATGPVTDHTLSLDASWEADVWGRIRRTVEASEANAQASAADLESARLSAQADLAQDYFLLRVTDAQQQLLNDTVAAYERSLQLTKNQYAAGVAAKADVVQAETQLKTTQAQAIDVGVQRAQLEHAIALLVGKPASTFSIAPERLAATAPSIPVGVPSQLLERRPDIAATERQVAAANAQIGVAESAYFPSLTLAASGGFENASFARWLSAPSLFWSVGPALAATLFDGGLRQAQTEQARAAYDAAVAGYRQTVLTAFQQVEDNLAALRILKQEAQVQDQAVKAARESVTLTTNQYKAGTVSYLNVVTVQAAALANERTAMNIIGQQLTASVLLIKALGGGWNVSQLPDAGTLAGNQSSLVSSATRGSPNAQK